MGLFEEMDKFDKRNDIKIVKDANSMHGTFGYDNPIELMKDSLENKKLGSMIAMARIFGEMGVENVFPLLYLVGMIEGKGEIMSMGDVMEFLNKFSEEQLVIYAGRVVKGRMMYDTHKKKGK